LQESSDEQNLELNKRVGLEILKESLPQLKNDLNPNQLINSPLGLTIATGSHK
jgi:hypothetical protein